MPDPKTSTRARNWLKSPWNVLTGYANFTPTDKTAISIKSDLYFFQPFAGLEK